MSFVNPSAGLGPNPFGVVNNDPNLGHSIGPNSLRPASNSQTELRSLGPNPFGVPNVKYHPHKGLKTLGHVNSYNHPQQIGVRACGLSVANDSFSYSRGNFECSQFPGVNSAEIWQPDGRLLSSKLVTASRPLFRQPPISLDTLPDEILLLVADAFDLREMFDVRSLKSLALVCRNVSRVTLDSIRLRKRIASCFIFEQKILRNHYWDLVEDATMFNKYAFYSSKVVEFVSQAIQTSNFRKQNVALPLAGWENIFSVGLLLRARITGIFSDFPFKLDIRQACRIKVVEEQILEHPSAFTNIEKLALIYSCALFQVAFKSLHSDKSTYHIWHRMNFAWQETEANIIMGSAFLMEGPLFLLRLHYGWNYDGLWHGQNKWLDTRDVYLMAEELSSHRIFTQCEVEPRKDALVWLYKDVWDNISELARTVKSNDLAPFKDIGLDEKSAETLVTCANVWAAAPHERFCPWYHRFRYS